MQLFHIWSRDVHLVQTLLLCTKFHENPIIFMAHQHTDARYWNSKSVLLSVCPSVCPLRSGIECKRLNISSCRHICRHVNISKLNIYVGLTYRHSFFYQHRTHSRNSDGVTPCGGAKYRWSIKISRFSKNKSLYLANNTRYRHSYDRRRIGTRMRSIKWCHFQ